jgi:hypothetical protein
MPCIGAGEIDHTCTSDHLHSPTKASSRPRCGGNVAPENIIAWLPTAVSWQPCLGCRQVSGTWGVPTTRWRLTPGDRGIDADGCMNPPAGLLRLLPVAEYDLVPGGFRGRGWTLVDCDAVNR